MPDTMYTRQDVSDLGGDWADPILWYARGVAAMMERPLAERTSWRFYAGIHGFDGPLWQQLGYLSSSDPLPSAGDRKTFWAQCQHASWYFLPWHRGYLLAFEANIRAAVTELGGPADWALPYWNYFEPDDAALPPAFASPDWPDGTGNNPLFVEPRYGPDGDGNVCVILSRVNLQAMNDPDFTGVSHGGSPGFGGIDTGFSHQGGTFGAIEAQPHNVVHGLVGGYRQHDWSYPGAMADPDSAGLDPIFWLHHANIDRLWASWNATQPPGSHLDPTDSTWLDGPAGPRTFVMPMPDGSTYTYTPDKMQDTAVLGYQYDNLSPATVVSTQERLDRLGISPPAADGAQTMSRDVNVELVGATTESVPVRGADVRGAVRLDADMRRKVISSLSPPSAADDTQVSPDRLFLNLENVRGQSDAAVFQVYLGVPDDEDPADHPDRLAGSVAPFGLRKASMPDEEHAGQGLTFVLEVTDIVDQLHLDDSFDVDRLPVRIVPVRPVPDEAQLTIGRISIFRQNR